MEEGLSMRGLKRERSLRVWRTAVTPGGLPVILISRAQRLIRLACTGPARRFIAWEGPCGTCAATLTNGAIASELPPLLKPTPRCPVHSPAMSQSWCGVNDALPENHEARHRLASPSSLPQSPHRFRLHQQGCPRHTARASVPVAAQRSARGPRVRRSQSSPHRSDARLLQNQPPHRSLGRLRDRRPRRDVISLATDLL